jgi:anaerobic magnesium-protoporphyrin IX monomethyl ester cyclase
MRVVLGTVPTPGQRVRQGESLGLRYLAAMAKANGHDVLVREATDSTVNPRVFARELATLRPDVVGLGVQFSKQAAPTASVADEIRKHSSAPIVVGGQALNFAWSEMMDLSAAIDVSVCFEAEETLVELLTWLGSGGGGDPPRGIFIRGDGGIANTGYRDPVESLDDLPFPTRDEASHAYGQPNFSVLTSRGCQSGCTFCSSGNFGNRYHTLPRWRPRSSANVTAEITELVDLQGARAISIVDDDFLGGDAQDETGLLRALEIAEQLSSLRRNVKFSIELRADETLKAPFEELKRAGLSHVFVGLDGATEFDLKLYAKRVHLPTLADAVKRIRECGLTASYGVIIFNPLSTIQRVRESVEYLDAIDVLTSDHLVNRLAIYRGSPLLSYFQREDVAHTWDKGRLDYAYELTPEVEAILAAFRRLAAQFKPLELEISRASFRFATGIDVAPEDQDRQLARLAALAGELRSQLASAAVATVDDPLAEPAEAHDLSNLGLRVREFAATTTTAVR